MKFTPKATATALSMFGVVAATLAAAGTATADPTPARDYPQPPAAIATAVAKASGTCMQISAPTLTGILYVQSGFDTAAVGPLGTAGVGQLFPRDFETYGADDNGDGRADITDPLESTMALSRLLCRIAADVDAKHSTDATYPGSPAAVQAYLTKFNSGVTEGLRLRTARNSLRQ